MGLGRPRSPHCLRARIHRPTDRHPARSGLAVASAVRLVPSAEAGLLLVIPPPCSPLLAAPRLLSRAVAAIAARTPSLGLGSRVMSVVAFAYLAPADDVKKAVDETGDAAKKAVKWLASRLTAAS